MAIWVRTTISVVFSKASVTLLVIAKRLHTSEPPPFRSKSNPEATKGETELTNETRKATHATIPALASLSVANATTDKLVSTVMSIKGLIEEVAKHITTSCTTDSTATQAPIDPSEAESRPENQESTAVSPKISPKLVTTTAAALSKATVAARDAAAESCKSKAAATQCTCPKWQPHSRALRTHNRRPTQHAHESSAVFMERKMNYEREKEWELHWRRVREQYDRQMHNRVRVQDPLQGHWHEMPALVASCALHCLASRLQDERDAREKDTNPQPSKPRIHRLVRARQKRAQANANLEKLKNEDTEEDRKMGGTLARSCLNPAETKSATLSMKKPPLTPSPTTTPIKKPPILPDHPSTLPTSPLPLHHTHTHQLQALRTRLNLHAHDLALLRTKEHKLAATRRVLVARNLPVRFHSAKLHLSMDTVRQKLSTVGRRMKKARVLERELCGLIEGDEEEAVGGWRRKGGRERWGWL